jgi:hypothetical protein
MSLGRFAFALVTLALIPSVSACSADSGSSPAGAAPDAAADAAVDAVASEAGPDAGADASSGSDASDSAMTLTESEPNDGATVDEYDELPEGASMAGAVQEPGDIDVFRVQTQPGKLYRATLSVPTGSSLQGHLTVMDDGRNGKPAGDDFVKMAVVGTAASAEVVFIAMGQGAHFFAVRDARNVQGQTVGGPGFDYQLEVNEVAVTASIEASALSFPLQTSGLLDQPAGLRLFPFEGNAGTNVLFDVKATADADFRLFVFSKTEADWIARNDDRASGDPNPLIDAPLTASGSMWLVVENIDPAAASLGFALQGSLP